MKTLNAGYVRENMEAVMDMVNGEKIPVLVLSKISKPAIIMALDDYSGYKSYRYAEGEEDVNGVVCTCLQRTFSQLVKAEETLAQVVESRQDIIKDT
ncbi:MAG: hypothetical protein LBK01_00630 [Burkholderiaceae bacterium]|jgi:hypothetical protein|nr:hypothetical protein [Burkholderiaceae bacterium]